MTLVIGGTIAEGHISAIKPKYTVSLEPSNFSGHFNLDFNRVSSWKTIEDTVGVSKLERIVFDWSVTKFIQNDKWIDIWPILFGLLAPGGSFVIDQLMQILYYHNTTHIDKNRITQDLELENRNFEEIDIRLGIGLPHIPFYPSDSLQCRTPDGRQDIILWDRSTNTNTSTLQTIFSESRKDNLSRFIFNNLREDIYTGLTFLGEECPGTDGMKINIFYRIISKIAPNLKVHTYTINSFTSKEFFLVNTSYLDIFNQMEEVFLNTYGAIQYLQFSRTKSGTGPPTMSGMPSSTLAYWSNEFVSILDRWNQIQIMEWNKYFLHSRGFLVNTPEISEYPIQHPLRNNEPFEQSMYRGRFIEAVKIK